MSNLMRMITKIVSISLFIVTTINAGKHIVIDLTKQEAYAYENGKLVMSGWVSTGKPGHRTPRGRFKILEKDLNHVSSKYPEPNGGARMDYMMRLTSGGIAMHLGYVPNYPASHGCIRMQNGFAQRMFNWARVGTPVRIKGSPPVRVSRGDSKKSKKVASTITRERIKKKSSPTRLSLNSRRRERIVRDNSDVSSVNDDNIDDILDRANAKVDGTRDRRSSRRARTVLRKDDIYDANCVIDDPINLLSSVPGKAKCSNSVVAQKFKRKRRIYSSNSRRVKRVTRVTRYKYKYRYKYKRYKKKATHIARNSSYNYKYRKVRRVKRVIRRPVRKTRIYRKKRSNPLDILKV